jgi:hypothetical protein
MLDLLIYVAISGIVFGIGFGLWYMIRNTKSKGQFVGQVYYTGPGQTAEYCLVHRVKISAHVWNEPNPHIVTVGNDIEYLVDLPPDKDWHLEYLAGNVVVFMQERIPQEIEERMDE